MRIIRLLFNSFLSLIIVGLFMSASPVKVMPTGDSLTGMNTPGYRGYLYKMLKDSGFVVDFVGGDNSIPTDPLNTDGDNSGFGGYVIGPDSSALDPNHGGKGTASITWELEHDENIMSKGADVMILMIGVNDFWNNKNTAYNPRTVGAIRLDTLVEKIYRFSHNIKLIVSNLTPARWNLAGADYAIFNAGVPAIVQKQKDKGRNCYFVNNCKGDLVTSDYVDDIHFVSSGYQKLAKNFYKVLAPVLKSITNTATNDVKSSKINLFPNPATDNITIKDTAGKIEIAIFLGQTVRLIKNYYGEPIGLNDLSSGVYVVRTENGSFPFVKR
ncbi:MAG: GDSL-type esterase/lipase family protein [Bacteroidota bacterium]|nr:GDSL-type esterase/lipase family protein [Bacteroidota bacterium]